MLFMWSKFPMNNIKTSLKTILAVLLLSVPVLVYAEPATWTLQVNNAVLDADGGMNPDLDLTRLYITDVNDNAVHQQDFIAGEPGASVQITVNIPDVANGDTLKAQATHLDSQGNESRFSQQVERIFEWTADTVPPGPPTTLIDISITVECADGTTCTVITN